MCLTCGCMDAHKQMGKANITYEDVKAAADENGQIGRRDARHHGARPSSRTAASTRRSTRPRPRRAPDRPDGTPAPARHENAAHPGEEMSGVRHARRSVAGDPDQPAPREHAVGDEDLAVLGDLDAARLRQLAARELAAACCP